MSTEPVEHRGRRVPEEFMSEPGAGPERASLEPPWDDPGPVTDGDHTNWAPFGIVEPTPGPQSAWWGGQRLLVVAIGLVVAVALALAASLAVPSVDAPLTSSSDTSTPGRPTAAPTSLGPTAPTKTTPTLTFFPRLDGPIVGIGGLCIDLNGGLPYPGNFLKTWTCNGTDAQLFIAETDGTLRVRGLCVEPGPAGPSATDVVVQTCVTGRAEQQWRFGGGQLRNPSLDRCVTAQRDSTSPGIGVVLLTCAARPGQLWNPPA